MALGYFSEIFRRFRLTSDIVVKCTSVVVVVVVVVAWIQRSRFSLFHPFDSIFRAVQSAALFYVVNSSL